MDTEPLIAKEDKGIVNDGFVPDEDKGGRVVD